MPRSNESSREIVQYDFIEGRYSAGEASLYAEPNNIQDLATKIEYLLDDPEKRIHMGQAGYRRMVEKFEWRHQAPKLLTAYQNIFGSLSGF